MRRDAQDHITTSTAPRTRRPWSPSRDSPHGSCPRTPTTTGREAACTTAQSQKASVFHDTRKTATPQTDDDSGAEHTEHNGGDEPSLLKEAEAAQKPVRWGNGSDCGRDKTGSLHSTTTDDNKHKAAIQQNSPARSRARKVTAGPVTGF
jgi:hypothetical protein